MAASAPAPAQTKDSIVVDGSDWMSASAVERRAFQVGTGNAMTAEGAYAKRRATAPVPVSAQLIKAVDRMTLAEVEPRITRGYEANPGRLSTPVMGGAWRELINPRQ